MELQKALLFLHFKQNYGKKTSGAGCSVKEIEKKM